jgi:hypothetical protein
MLRPTAFRDPASFANQRAFFVRGNLTRRALMWRNAPRFSQTVP